MAEYNKQRYYWIKISDTFMNSYTIDFLMSKKDGANYVVLYQMLCLKTVNNNGQLAQNLGEILIPYDTEKIQRETKWFSADTIRVAMDLYQKIGLIYEQKNGVLKIADFENLIASQTISAEKKKTYRAKIAQNKIENDRLQLGGTKGGQMSTDIDIEIEIDKEIDKDKEKAAATKSDDIDKEFENLWSLYPRKQGKANALKAYRKARKGKPEVYKTVEDGIKRYISYLEKKKTKPEYIKQGSTWFNQRCWEDDYSTGGYGNDGTYKGLDKASRWGKVGQEF